MCITSIHDVDEKNVSLYIVIMYCTFCIHMSFLCTFYYTPDGDMYESKERWWWMLNAWDVGSNNIFWCVKINTIFFLIWLDIIERKWRKISFLWIFDGVFANIQFSRKIVLRIQQIGHETRVFWYSNFFFSKHLNHHFTAYSSHLSPLD